MERVWNSTRMSRANQNNKSFHKWHQIWRQMLQMKRKANEGGNQVVGKVK